MLPRCYFYPPTRYPFPFVIKSPDPNLQETYAHDKRLVEQAHRSGRKTLICPGRPASNRYTGIGRRTRHDVAQPAAIHQRW